MNQMTISHGSVTVITDGSSLIRNFISEHEMRGYYRILDSLEDVMSSLEGRVGAFPTRPDLVERLRVVAERIVAECVAKKLEDPPKVMYEDNLAHAKQVFNILFQTPKFDPSSVLKITSI